MKTSKRYMGGTLLAILALPVLIVIYSRFLAPPPEARPPPERTPAATLAALRDYTAIEVQGDFALEITEGPAYAFSYEPLSDVRGELVARVEEGTLHLRGFGNWTTEQVARVRISVPDLQAIDANFLQVLRVSGVSGENLALRAVQVRRITVADNTLGTLDIRSIANDTLEFEGNTITTTTFNVIGGDTNITTRN